MQEFIARGNIERFRARIRASSDDRHKSILRDLLHAEEQKLDEIQQAKHEERRIRESTYFRNGKGGSEGGRR